LESKKPVSGFRFLSWYALGPMAFPSAEFIENSRVCYISGVSAWTWKESNVRLQFINKSTYKIFNFR